MKKKEIKKSKPAAKILFKDIKFNRSFITILLAILIIILSFIIYSHYTIEIPPEEYEEIIPAIEGDECITDSDCPQPRCMGMKNLCENGYCIIRQTAPAAVKCIDLKSPVCGNGICEAEEKNKCPEDC